MDSVASSATQNPNSPGCTKRPSTDRFRLSGPSRTFDPRIHAVRRDIADIALADWLFAPHYAQAEPASVKAPAVMLRIAPDGAAGSQLLHGEDFAVLDITRGWAWGYGVHDHYVGYIEAATLGPLLAPTHYVSVRTAPVFMDADIKAPVVMTLSLGAKLTGVVEGQFLKIEQGYVHQRHYASIDMTAADPVTIAETLMGASYLWGGRGAGGIDCSGLIQLALELTGQDCPRDSDQQGAALGRDIPEDAPLKRSDLIFFPGHVGLMTDPNHLIHANAFWMAVTVDPLDEVVGRLKAQHEQPILARRRLVP